MADLRSHSSALVARLIELTGTPATTANRLLASLRGDEQAFVAHLVEHGLGDEGQVYRVYADSLGLDFEAPDVVDLDASVLQTVPVEAMRRYRAIPMRWDQGAMVTAMVNPLDLLSIDGFQEVLGAPVMPVLTTPRFLAETLRHREQMDQGIEGLLAKFELNAVDESALASPQRLREIAGDDAIVQLVDFLVDQALRRRASDIHIEPGRDHVRVRYRIDGDLETVQRLPKPMHSALLTRLKILANLDIAERRRPQDGRFRRESGERAVEFRVSSLPSMHGEKAVLRILDKGRISLDLHAQGFSPRLAEALLGAAGAANGMVLVTGPTGSGKTTTLYGVLAALNTEDRNVVTVEDPVEYELPGITQVQVDVKAERSFGSVLRAILRQDPDVIMVGEIRDRETAELAVHAALTGHMVLSTLHTNSALGATTRLIDVGVEPYLLAPTLRAIVAQRLVRKLCVHCAEPGTVPSELLAALEVPVSPGATFRRAVGCRNCRRCGYAGRTPIHEVLTWTPELTSLLSRRADETALAEVARRNGFRTLAHDGVAKAAAGLTSVEEVAAAVRM
ncbi:MAG: GspE/PulE family protein [Planctomycetota bacterium]